MAGFGAKSSLFFDDLKHSWYFRIWVFAWLFCAVITFICLIILGQRATTVQKEQPWRLWIENAQEIAYPSFTIKTNYDEANSTITNVFCEWGSRNQHPVIVPTSNCANGEPTTRCVFVGSSGYFASQQENHLDCKINVTAPNSGDKILLFQIYEQADFGASITWVSPNDNAVIYLTKTVIESKGKDPSVIWQHQINYHSSVVEGNFFAVRFSFDTFAVFHWQEDTGFDTWLSVGGIGGFAFFMLIMHTIFMTIVGTCLPNESKFLSSGTASSVSSEYQAVR